MKMKQIDFTKSFNKRILNYALKHIDNVPLNRTHRHVCIVTKNKKVICWGANINRTHPIMFNYRFYRRHVFIKHKNDFPNNEFDLHAEIHALVKLPSFNVKINKLTFYILKINRKNKIGLSKPCEVCQQILKERGIEKVYYS